MITIESIAFSAPAFSFLLFENTKSTFQQEGFLLGEIVHQEASFITDSDQEQIKITKTIKINGVVPCPHVHYFYSGDGKIDKNKIRTLLKNDVHNVVAWYKYQRSTNLHFTFRNKVVHKQLQKFFGVNPNYFTCCLLLSEESKNRAVHTFTQIFMRCQNGAYSSLPFAIPNLNNAKDSYKSPAEQPSETFLNIMEQLKIDRLNDNALVSILRIEDALQNHIEILLKKLSIAEQEVFKLEQEVEQMQKQKKQRPDISLEETGQEEARPTTAEKPRQEEHRPGTSTEETAETSLTTSDTERSALTSEEFPISRIEESSTSRMIETFISRMDEPSTSRTQESPISRIEEPSGSRMHETPTSRMEGSSTSRTEEFGVGSDDGIFDRDLERAIDLSLKFDRTSEETPINYQQPPEEPSSFKETSPDQNKGGGSKRRRSKKGKKKEKINVK